MTYAPVCLFEAVFGEDDLRADTIAHRYNCFRTMEAFWGWPASSNYPARPLKPLAAGIGDTTLDFRKLRRSHSTFYAVLNVHPRVAQMSMGYGSFDTTMKYYTGVPADLQKQAAEALGELLFGVSDSPPGDPTPVKPESAGCTEDGVAGQSSCKYRN